MSSEGWLAVVLVVGVVTWVSWIAICEDVVILTRINGVMAAIAAVATAVAWIATGLYLVGWL